ncbi:nicotinamide n-methyltransferase [Cadophora gregata]|uniref:nicotinamide n-methyltransferase n=1 Tax=Cadophora gregata TaxID=51156 RepID=UPI0026DC3A6A|nr:nicotinamide n-methyltransferase [Cadophora gregata]KAK0104490.1 nicotinamide n-methyltransferase [Cadophora gregata]KAK0115418.1 nicotinamide n-methyltransferase [Cadophora gregata f. sp. sojae]
MTSPSQDDILSDDGGGLDLFTEPADYYPPSPTPTTETHTLLSGRTLTVNLVGHNPLWGHHLWNAGRLISTYLEKNPSLVKDKTVLELGAGAGLPSLVCAVLGARKVVVSDYPDPDLVGNLWGNVDAFYSGEKGVEDGKREERKLVAEGYCWGADVAPLLAHLPKSEKGDEAKGFEVLILADLLFNHSEHGKLVSTIEKTLLKSEDAKALVFFTPYRPWLYEKDMAFFDLVREKGFVVEKVLEEKMEKVMFVEDRGDEELRRTVFGYVVRWKFLLGS